MNGDRQSLPQQVEEWDAAHEADAEAAVAPEEHEPIPLPDDLQTALLVVILVLIVLYTLYFARAIVMPILFAFLLSLLLQPVMRAFSKLRVPAIIGAALAILLVFAALAALFSSLAAPAAGWFAKLPQSLPRLEEELWALKAPLARFHAAIDELNKLASSEGSAMAVVVQGEGIGSFLVTNTGVFLGNLFTTIVVLFFLLVSGDLFLRKLVEVLPRFQDKKRAVAISQEIERNISAYLVTITIMNLLVGVGVGLTALWSGLGDAAMWGALAFILNYMPLIGSFIGITLFFLGGLLALGTLWQAALIAGIYLAIHVLEGEFLTPMLVARRFTLNPVLVVISLIFWYWMWGMPGAIIAVPLLATVKIICDHVRPLMALGHFIGG